MSAPYPMDPDQYRVGAAVRALLDRSAGGRERGSSGRTCCVVGDTGESTRSISSASDLPWQEFKALSEASVDRNQCLDSRLPATAPTYSPSLKVSGFTLHERKDHRLWRCVAGVGKFSAEICVRPHEADFIAAVSSIRRATSDADRCLSGTRDSPHREPGLGTGLGPIEIKAVAIAVSAAASLSDQTNEAHSLLGLRDNPFPLPMQVAGA